MLYIAHSFLFKLHQHLLVDSNKAILLILISAILDKNCLEIYEKYRCLGSGSYLFTDVWFETRIEIKSYAETI